VINAFSQRSFSRGHWASYPDNVMLGSAIFPEAPAAQ
jgi:hypothetical protein